MVSKVTMEQIFGIMGDNVDSHFHSWSKVLPQSLLDSGIYPIDNSKCSAEDKKNPSQQRCFAMISVAWAVSERS